MTALFVDLVDSTALADGTDPERVRSVLKDYFSLVSTIVAAWGGTVEKYAGDAVLAVFGVPRVREDDPARAVSAAAEIVRRVSELGRGVDRIGGTGVAVRIGIDTGEAIVPTEVRADRPLATGDVMNVAARLEAVAGRGEVLVGERTAAATAPLFRYADAVDLVVKGKAGPVRARRLVGRIEGAVEAGPARNLQARLVGRERELGVLAGLLDEAIESRSPRLAVLYGLAGIGKSRLAREAVAVASSERPDLAVLRGRCPALGEGMTFWPLAEIVRAAAGISLDDASDVAAAKLRDRTAEVMTRAQAADDAATGVAFALATTAGIDLPGNPLDQSRPSSVFTELGRRWPQFLSALAQRQPVIVVIEDLHWASDQVVEILERLLLRSTGPILLVTTARPEFAERHREFVAGRPDVATLSLRPLARAQATSLLAGLGATGQLDPHLRDQILETAEGNPLFIEEIVTRLIEAGALTAVDGERVARHADIALPDTVGALLAARIDALPDEERRVLREAAVVGRVFWEAPVAAALGGRGVTDALARLERRGLVSMRPTSSLGGEVEYQFKHALVRDVAYNGLSLARRSEAHAAVAAWLGELSTGRPEELADLVAAHWRAALDAAPELAWPPGSPQLAEARSAARRAFLVAGAGARKRFAIGTAVKLHETAVELSADDAERAEALEALGDDHDAAYDGDRAVPAWEQAVELRRAAGAPEDVARLTLKIARMGAVRWGGFSAPIAPELLDRHVDLGLERATDPDTRAWLLVMRAAVGLRWVGFHRPDPVPLEERVTAAAAALERGDASGDVALQANAVRMLASLQLARGQVAPALALMRTRLDLIPRIGDPRERHLVTIETGYTLAWTGGDAAAMIPLLKQALALGRELRTHDVCHSTGTLIGALYLAGDWDAVAGYADEHLAAFAADEAGTSCPFALGAFPQAAIVAAHRGDLPRAQDLVARMPTSEAPVGTVEALQALAALALGDPERARATARRVLDTGARNFAEEPPIELFAMIEALVALGDWNGIHDFAAAARPRVNELAVAGPALDRAEGLAARAAGDVAGARDRLERALAGFEPIAPFEAARTREELSTVAPARRDELLRDALATYERLGATPFVERVRARFAGQLV